MKEDDDNPADAGQMKLEGGNAVNEKGCNHFFIKYPPVVGKIKTCIKCGILLAPGGIQGGYNTVRLSGNHIEMTVATAPANPASGLVRMYATSATSVRMRDSAGTETDLAAVTRAGGNTTEATTTSTTAVDLLSVAALSIAAASPFMFGVNGRKTVGLGVAVGFGWKLNTTTIDEAGTTNDAVFKTDVVNTADDGYAIHFVGSRVTNYQRARSGAFTDQSSAGGNRLALIIKPSGAQIIATITDFVIRAISGDAAVTAGADELHIYTLATS